MPGACASPWAREWITAPAARVDVGGTTASVAGIAVAVQLDFVPKCGQNYLARTSVTSLRPDLRNKYRRNSARRNSLE